MADFAEVADRVWVARYEWADVNVTAIGSERGLVVVDTHASTTAGYEVLADLERLGAGRVAHVVNTHWHWDHTFGNAAFRETVKGAPIYAHEETAALLAERGEEEKRRLSEPPGDPHGPEVGATEIALPDRTFDDTHVIDLGDRMLELAFPGRGHTAGDIVVRVTGTDVLVAGDLVESSAKPSIGLDSWPLDWPATLDAMLQTTTGRTVVVPGHGHPVDPGFVRAQRNELAQIADVIRSFAAHGEPADAALLDGDWPWEMDEQIRNAVTRGFETFAPGAPDR